MHDGGEPTVDAGLMASSGPEAVLVSDVRGTVRFLNQACARLLECDPRKVSGSSCWEVARMRCPDGSPFCGPDCPVQREIRSGGVPSPLDLVYPSPRGPAIDMRMVTVPIHSTPRRCAVLHLLAPIDPLEKWSTDQDRPATRSEKTDLPDPPRPVIRRKKRGPRPPVSIPTERFGCLSDREREILDLIARGYTTRGIGRKLFISSTTVNNHVQSVLRKLELHRRIEAVVLWLRQQP